MFLKFDLIPRAFIISLNLNAPLDTLVDSANVVGFVAKSCATHGDTLPPLESAESANPPCAIDTVKYVICGSAGDTA